MSRRMVVRCDTCGEQEDMVTPGAVLVSVALGAPARSMKPQPPDGWFERFGGLQGYRDFCSAACVAAWDHGRRTTDVTPR